MKRIAILLLLLIGFQFSMAQTMEYGFYEDLPYYKSPTNTYQKNRCVLDLYYPKNKSGFKSVVWFHGGGIEAGEKEIPEYLKEKGIAVIGVNYRLSPKVKAPVYIEDAAAAIAWTLKNIDKYGGDPNKIFVSGHSAGAYLAMMAIMDPTYLNAHALDPQSIAHIIPMSGHTITHFTIRKERGIPGEQAIIDEFAPIYHAKSNLPPITLITGDRKLELLGRYEENAYFYRMMKVNKHKQIELIELQGYDHGMTYPAFPILLKIVNKHP